MHEKVSQLSSHTILFGEVKKLGTKGELFCPEIKSGLLHPILEVFSTTYVFPNFFLIII